MINTIWLKFKASCSDNFLKSKQKENIKEGVECPLKKDESLVALKMSEWVSGAVIWLHLQYLESIKNQFIENLSRERRMGADAELIDGILIIYLKLIHSVIQLPQFVVMLIQPPLRFIGVLRIS